ELAEKLSAERDDFRFRYIDIHAEGISKEDLEKTVGKPVATVPQIFIDQEHIGGCTDFEAYAKEHLSLYSE
ncbi:MAG: GrxA family glutaredoxin, partial [Plesiomonas sp.]